MFNFHQLIMRELEASLHQSCGVLTEPNDILAQVRGPEK